LIEKLAAIFFTSAIEKDLVVVVHHVVAVGSFGLELSKVVP
jgi:hypothetical protein